MGGGQESEAGRGVAGRSALGAAAASRDGACHGVATVEQHLLGRMQFEKAGVVWGRGEHPALQHSCENHLLGIFPLT